jgi:hypothetical protein
MNNPPAFPTGTGVTPYNPGMTLRDYFAAKALQGYISARGWHPDFTRAADAVAVASYQYADAMMKAREQ